ncbi:MAG TPA: aminotransferase class I/II-fold pyridoxal phosphate-dependent enzyme [Chloroflexi bacterium]|nr:aminotransferase class I/II-fold pyridoxal phosphate-dependent enzyme [Chloroflexota bacterium]
MTPPPLAARTQPFIESVIREMTRLAEEHAAINLSQGLPDFDPPEPVRAAAIEALRQGANQYSFTWGDPRFRAAIAEKYRRDNDLEVDPEQEVTVTCGVSEGVVAAVLALSDPGDEAIILEPYYENYVPACLMAGLIPRYVSLRPPAYTLDPEELEAAWSPRTRLLLLTNPDNPTGRVFRREELAAIADFCVRRNVIAVVDEIYEYITYGEHRHISLATLPGMAERTVTVSGLGKSYAVTGWRVGWTVAAPSLTALIRKAHDYLTICAPTPFQVAGITALRLPPTYYDQLRADYHRRRAILLEALEVTGFPFTPPQGAYYVMAEITPFGFADDWAFATHLVREIGVAVVPGSSFYHRPADGAQTVRFTFAKRESTLREAARRLARLRKR